MQLIYCTLQKLRLHAVTMPRIFKRKTDQGLVPPESMLQAVKDVVERGLGVRKVAKTRGLSKSTLHRYVEKYKRDQNSAMSPNYTHNQMCPSSPARVPYIPI